MRLDTATRTARLAVIAIIPLLGIAWAESVDQSVSDRLAVAARGFLAEAVEREKLSGAVALLARDGEIVFFEAAGAADREAGKPMREDTLFRIASMSKPITSVAVMMLHEEGHFELDDPVSKFIPEFASQQVLAGGGSDQTGPAAGPVSIRQLLSHTSGITYRFMDIEPLATIYDQAGVSDGLVQTEGTIGEGVRRLAGLPLLFEPGSQWSYGLSTDVLGYFVEVVSGKPLDRFLEDRIFTPLGMNDTGFFLSPEDAGSLAAVYAGKTEGGIEKLDGLPIVEGHLTYSTSYHYDGPRTYFSGGAGLVSTTWDYYRFTRMLANGGTLDGARILKPETVDLMTRNQIGALSIGGGDKFGLGFLVKSKTDETGARGTHGWGGFFHTTFWIDPENDLIGIFMSQLRPAEGQGVTGGFVQAVYKALSETQSEPAQ